MSSALPPTVANHVRAIEDRALGARVIAETPLPGVGAGSALLAIAGGLLAVHDDAFRVTRIALPSLETTSFVLRGDGAALRKPLKPDFEAAVATGEGVVYLLGSGSTDRRCTVARLDLRNPSVTLADRTALYRCVSAALGAPPNIEGAIAAGDRLRVFHRGVGDSRSAIVELPLGVLDGLAPAVLDVVGFDLGALDGVPLGFTDAAHADGGRIAFIAAAEDAPDAIADGPVRGSVVGIVTGAAPGTTARWTRLVDRDGRPWRAKAEGLALDADFRGAWILTDPDDPERATVLGRVELRGFE